MAETLKLGNGIWATKENSLLSYNDENGNYKPLPFDFTRASSATVVNKAGLIETVGTGTPRIDFLGNTNGALLLEPQRTNLLLNSDNGSTWSLSNLTLSSLSGGLNKEYYQITSLGNTGRFDVVKNDWINTTASTYTASVFAKKGTTDEIILTSRAGFTTQDIYSVFNLTNGTVVSNNAVAGSIESYSDGWYKCSITFTNSGGYTNFASFAFGFNFNSSSTDTLFVASPQSEIGGYPTSYIPTQGSTVTRVAEICSGAGNDQVINSTEGVLYAEVAFIADDNTITASEITISDETLNNNIRFLYSPTTSFNSLFVRFDVAGVRVATFNYVGMIVTDFNKVAIKWKENDFALWINGIEVLTDLSGATFSSSTLSTINFSKAVGGDNFYGNTKDLRVYNTALTDAQLQTLTTI